MGRCGGMAAYVVAIVLLVALFASSAKCRPEPLDVIDNKASGSNGNAMALNSTAAASVSGGGGRSGDVKLEWCILRKCVYEGTGSKDCICCAATKPTVCFETMKQCRDNCV